MKLMHMRILILICAMVISAAVPLVMVGCCGEGPAPAGEASRYEAVIDGGMSGDVKIYSVEVDGAQYIIALSSRGVAVCPKVFPTSETKTE